MLTFGPLTAFNERTSQPLPGTPIQVFTLDGALVDTFTLDGAPLTLVSNARGYVGMFQADTTERVLVARARGGNDQPVYAHETLDDAADLTEIVNHGRLSEAELLSTIDARIVSRETGARDISSALAPEWATTTTNGRFVHLLRAGDLVFLSGRLERVNGFGISRAGNSNVLDLPTGFRPAIGTYTTRGSANTGSEVGLLTNESRTVIGMRGMGGVWSEGDSASFEAWWRTTDPWPSSLPGTPA